MISSSGDKTLKTKGHRETGEKVLVPLCGRCQQSRGKGFSTTPRTLESILYRRRPVMDFTPILPGERAYGEK